VLYAMCARCGAIDGLVCNGQFMPHFTQLMVATPMGPACPMCGVLPPIFTCAYCWTRQLLVIPGAPVPAANVAGMGQTLAPVVQAPQNAPKSNLVQLFEPAMKELGKGAAQAIFGQ
jgi:hypothetical protein